MRKKLLTLGLSVVLGCTLLTGCGGSSSDNKAEGETYKVGIIQFVDDASLNQIEQNVEKELDAKAKELGVTFEYKDYVENGQADPSALASITTDLLDKGVDILVPIATPTVQVVKSNKKLGDTPVVFSAVTDPVGAGLVESMEEPGANITGTSDALNTEAVMDLVLAAKPDTDYVGLLYSKSEDASKQAIKDAKAYLDAKNIKYIEKTGNTQDEVQSAADALVAEKVDAVFTPTDNTIMTAELAIYQKFQKAQIPHYCGADSFALNGSFVGYGVDYANLGVETADMVADILVNGADPAKTAVKTFDNGVATINTETCEAVGFKLDEVKKAFEELCSEIKETETGKEFK